MTSPLKSLGLISFFIGCAAQYFIATISYGENTLLANAKIGGELLNSYEFLVFSY